MRRRMILTAVVLSALLWGLAPDGLEASEARLSLVGHLQHGRVQRGTEFSAPSLGDLRIVVEYRDLSGIHTQRIELYSPDGSLYQRFSTSFKVAAAVDPGKALKSKCPTCTQLNNAGLAKLKAAVRWEPVETRLPVWGTWITQYSLFGAWRVEVYLDRERMPITTGVFVLNP